MSFEDFAMTVGEISDDRADPHFRSQWTTVMDKKNNFLPDYIGRFENLRQDFAFVSEKMGSPIRELPHLLKTYRRNYKENYNEKTIEIVRRRYARDLEMFQYDF
jgi:hypothetical protein